MSNLNEQFNFNKNQLELIQSGSSHYHFPGGDVNRVNDVTGDYIKVSIFNSDGRFREEFNSDIYQASTDTTDISWIDGDFSYVIDATNTVHIKPNDILTENVYPRGNYNLTFDFFRNVFNDLDVELTNPSFFISQISPSRKEIRLYGRYDVTMQSGDEIKEDIKFDESFRDKFKSILGTLNSADSYDRYGFRYVLNVKGGNHLVINNYEFDNITDDDFVSLVLKLNEPLPIQVRDFEHVSIEKELLNSQFLSIFYESDVKSTSIGGNLEPDIGFSIDLENESFDSYQSYNDIHAKTQNVSFQNILNEISSSNQNLNIDFNHFKNHTFFGSATKKLENFKYKVGKIQNYLSEVSTSLSLPKSVWLDGDSVTVKNRRQELFKNVEEVVTSFTPYEKFLYYDAQSQTTASAPGLGVNLISDSPVANESYELTTLSSSYDGFNVVYKHERKNLLVDLFTGKYKAEEAPFFNTSGSLYLSFLIKGKVVNTSNNDSWDGDTSTHNLRWINNNEADNIPSKAFGGSRIENPSITGSMYQRVILAASQSYWKPLKSITSGFDFSDSGEGVWYQILTGSNITGSGPISTHDSSYYDTYPSQYGSDISFTGSIMPMGELFNVNYKSAATNKSFITDIKITKNNPVNSFPFDMTFKTGSTSWDNWYTGIHASASSFDNDNIHSLKNNLPEFIKNSTDYDELFTFIHMIGEHFDLMRNYIDNYNLFSSRKYSQLESVPGELLPTVVKSFGWDLINPYSSSLDNWYSYNSSGASRKTIAENTYRKILNNLIYIYKSKGTVKSIKGLLNCYGYPADFIPIRQYGGNNESNETNLVLLSGTSTDNITWDAEPWGISNVIGNQSFSHLKDNYYSLNVSGDTTVKLPWWQESAKGDGIEFVFSSKKTTNTQELVTNSGSLNRKLWDVRIIPSTLNTSKLQFRLSTYSTGSASLHKNSISMSTDITSFQGGGLWNFYLTKGTGSLTTTESISMYAASQDVDKIPVVVSSSMVFRNSTAQQAFIGTGSHTHDSGNLVFGSSLSGSLSEIRMWSGSLSASSFKIHTLDKMSVRGNDLNSYKDNLIYRFKLNENTKSGSSPTFTDSSDSDTIKDFSRSSNLVNSGLLYNKNIIDFIRFGLRSDFDSLENNKKSVGNLKTSFIRNLNPLRSSLTNATKNDSNRKSSNFVEIGVSPTDAINRKILNEIGGFDITGKFGNPSQAKTGSRYDGLETLRNSILKNVKIDENKFINAYKTVFNKSLKENIKKVLPSTTKLSSFGVILKQDLLDRLKIQGGPKKIDTSEGTLLQMSLLMVDSDNSGSHFDFSKSIYDEHYLADILVNISGSGDTISNDGNDYIFSTSNAVSQSVTLNMVIPQIYNSDILVYNNTAIVSGSTTDLYQFNYNIVDNIIQSASQDTSYEKTISDTTGSLTAEKNPIYSKIIDIYNHAYTLSSSMFYPHSKDINMLEETYQISSNKVNNYDSIFNIISQSYQISAEKLTRHKFNLSPLSESFQLSAENNKQYTLDLYPLSSSYTLSSENYNSYNMNIQPLSESLLFSAEKNKEYNSSIFPLSESYTFTAEKFSPHDSNLNMLTESYGITGENLSIHNTNIHPVSESYVLTGENFTSHNLNLAPLSESYTLTGEKFDPHDLNLSPLSESYTLTGEKISTNDMNIYPLSESYTLTGENFVSHNLNLAPLSESILITSEKLNYYNYDLSPFTSSYQLSGNVNFGVHSVTLNISTSSIDLSKSDYIKPSSANILIGSSLLTVSSSIPYFYQVNLPDVVEVHDISGNLSLPYSSSINWIDENWLVPRIYGKEYYKGYGYISHGKGDNNIHYITKAGIHGYGEISGSDENIYKYDTVGHTGHILHSIGDVEIVSSSVSLVSGSDELGPAGRSERMLQSGYYTDFSDKKFFMNKKMVDIDSGVQYDSYINGGKGTRPGRPMGKTAYFSSSNGGEISYPINHWINYHTNKDQLSNVIYGKIKPLVTIVEEDGKLISGQEIGLGHFPNGLDLVASASVYTTVVDGTGVSRLKVERLNDKRKR